MRLMQHNLHGVALDRMFIQKQRLGLSQNISSSKECLDLRIYIEGSKHKGREIKVTFFGVDPADQHIPLQAAILPCLFLPASR